MRITVTSLFVDDQDGVEMLLEPMSHEAVPP